ncbi:MAG: VTT domain-containing protein [Methylacidiphilales bacterium]|nr:VTT domain-containing protein [Candidatus Methylacidiphilales bacterium]
MAGTVCSLPEMNPSPHAWWDLGYYGVFGCVFLEQLGVPIPAFPALLAAGALVASGELNLPTCLLTAVLAALPADLIWYGIGKIRGGAVLNLMCRLSWKPDTCVSKTKILFLEHGTKTLIFSKFIPGLSTLAPPLAGMARVPLTRFVAYDGLGSALWALVPLIAGAYLQKSFITLQSQMEAFKGWLPWLCGAAIIAVLVWRYLNRRFYTRELAQGLLAGINVADLKNRLDGDEDLTVIDVRDELSARSKAVMLPKARWIPYTLLPDRLEELALDKPIVVYCDCPKDQAAVAMADLLRERGGKDVRPLLGGLEAWMNQGWSTLEWKPE